MSHHLSAAFILRQNAAGVKVASGQNEGYNDYTVEPNRIRRATVAACLLFSVLSLVLTYPLALHLADAVEDRQDALLNVWITAWDGHQLVSDPPHLFDANIFHPYLRTLAYSELLLGNGLLALPITAVTGNPVLGYNMALLFSFVLTGLGTYLLVLGLTRSPGAGMVAGTILAYCSYRMTNLAQAQLLTTQWLPLSLLALVQLMRHPRPRYVLAFVLFFSLQALSSFYYGMLLAFAVLVLATLTLGVRMAVGVWHRPASSGGTRLALYLLLAASCCLLVLFPFARPYFQVQRELGFGRSLADSEPFSASLRQYATVLPTSVLYSRWLTTEEAPQAGGYPVDALFPGVTALALATVGVAAGRGRTRWLFLVLLTVSWVLSLGPRLYLAPGRSTAWNASLPYAWLYPVVPGFKALRAPVRFDALVMLSLAVLAGYGVATLENRVKAPSRRRFLSPAWLAGCCFLLVILESLVWPAAHAEHVPVGDSVPSTYRWLAERPATAILELPMAFSPGGPQLDYQYLSTTHWQTTPDGYSGFIPPKHGQIVYEMERFPWERSVSLLQALGVQYVVVHSNRYVQDRWRQMQSELTQVADLALVETLDTDHIYEVRPRPMEPADLSLAGYLPPRAVVDQPYTAHLIVINHGERSYAVPPTARLALDATWQMAGQSAGYAISADVPLVTSPDGGAAVIPTALVAPEQPGTYHLTLSLVSEMLGPITVEGEVTVGGPDAQGPVQFPVPVRLVSAAVPPIARSGQPLQVHLTWGALGKIDAYYSVYVKLLDSAGVAVAGWDGQPQNGAAPTLLWVPGTAIADTVSLAIPTGLPPGDYTVEVGMYRARDLARAMTLNAEGVPLEQVSLGPVRVEQ
jgi:hypothetical protein